VARSTRQRIDGVVLLDKPTGMSSNAALQKARWLYNAAKGGHTGTLDPLASGLLPLCLGEATKFSQMLLDADKTYVARLKLGIKTDTGDAEGEVISTRPVEVDEAAIDAVLPRFRGPISQVPPMHSALKRDGKPLYEYARAGVTLEREARDVVIHSLERNALEGDEFEIEVACSKGTYIRTLAEDIGEALGCGAHLVALRRTRIGAFEIRDAVPLAELESADRRAESLRAVDLLVSHLPVCELEGEPLRLFSHGQTIAQTTDLRGECRVFGAGCFLGLGSIGPDARLAPVRLIAFEPGA
jgi:tRNA pseudouridine55 synthase